MLCAQNPQNTIEIERPLILVNNHLCKNKQQEFDDLQMTFQLLLQNDVFLAHAEMMGT